MVDAPVAYTMGVALGARENILLKTIGKTLWMAVPADSTFKVEVPLKSSGMIRLGIFHIVPYHRKQQGNYDVDSSWCNRSCSITNDAEVREHFDTALVKKVLGTKFFPNVPEKNLHFHFGMQRKCDPNFIELYVEVYKKTPFV